MTNCKAVQGLAFAPMVLDSLEFQTGAVFSCSFTASPARLLYLPTFSPGTYHHPASAWKPIAVEVAAADHSFVGVLVLTAELSAQLVAGFYPLLASSYSHHCILTLKDSSSSDVAAGRVGTSGFADGLRGDAVFKSPAHMALGALRRSAIGNRETAVYIADHASRCVRRGVVDSADTGPVFLRISVAFGVCDGAGHPFYALAVSSDGHVMYATTKDAVATQTLARIFPLIGAGVPTAFTITAEAASLLWMALHPRLSTEDDLLLVVMIDGQGAKPFVRRHNPDSPTHDSVSTTLPQLPQVKVGPVFASGAFAPLLDGSILTGLAGNGGVQVYPPEPSLVPVFAPHRLTLTTLVPGSEYMLVRRAAWDVNASNPVELLRQANEACKEHVSGTQRFRLGTIETPAEQDAVARLINQRGLGSPYLITDGLFDPALGNDKWVRTTQANAPFATVSPVGACLAGYPCPTSPIPTVSQMGEAHLIALRTAGHGKTGTVGVWDALNSVATTALWSLDSGKSFGLVLCKLPRRFGCRDFRKG